MVDHLESFGGKFRDLRGTGMHIEDPVTLSALEMVVVMPGQLKARGLPRKVHGGDGLLISQEVQVAVDRG